MTNGINYITAITPDGAVLTQGVGGQRKLLAAYAECLRRKRWTWDSLPDICKVSELANVVGVDRKTLYEMIDAGTLPGVARFGRTIRIHKAAVLAFFGGEV